MLSERGPDALPENFVFRPRTVYEVSSVADDTVLVALNPEVRQTSSDALYVTWFDTSKGRTFFIQSVVTDTEDTFGFLDTEHRDYELQVMTLEAYHARVAPRLENVPDVQTEAEMAELLFTSLDEHMKYE